MLVSKLSHESTNLITSVATILVIPELVSWCFLAYYMSKSTLLPGVLLGVGLMVPFNLVFVALYCIYFKKDQTFQIYKQKQVNYIAETLIFVVSASFNFKFH